MNFTAEEVTLTRDCEAVEIPAGRRVILPRGTEATITQSLGGSYSLLVPRFGGLFRISTKDADAIGKEPEAVAEPGTRQREVTSPEQLEELVWDMLKTCYDPEIPVNIVDLGLIYDMQILPLPDHDHRVEVKMTLTAPGCGMGASIAMDAQMKLESLPGVKEAEVQVVWDPPWTPERISPEGRALLGLP